MHRTTAFHTDAISSIQSLLDTPSIPNDYMRDGGDAYPSPIRAVGSSPIRFSPKRKEKGEKFKISVTTTTQKPKNQDALLDIINRQNGLLKIQK
jgi:hypothetical protein